MTCPYNYGCMLPKDNQKYGVQLIFLVFSIGCIFTNSSTFSSLAILMYVVPIVIDLWTFKAITRRYKLFRFVFLVYNSAFFLFSMLGVTNFIKDTGTTFMVNEESFFMAGVIIPKTTLAFFMLVELLVPVILIFGSPSQKTIKIHRLAQKRRN